MTKLMVAALVLFSVVTLVSVAVGQPAPTDPNLQALPWWFVKHRYTPGMPWFYRAPEPAKPRPCRIAHWYPAQFWNTDQWGNTVTWVGYAPRYVCD